MDTNNDKTGCDACRILTDTISLPKTLDQSTEYPDYDASEPDLGWCTLPCVLLEEVFGFLNFDDRVAAACVCREWRHYMFTTPHLWRTIRLELRTRKDAQKTLFLCNCVVHSKEVRVHWPVTYSRNALKLRIVDAHIRDALTEVFLVMAAQCQNLHVLQLRLENLGAFDAEFTVSAKDSFEQILRSNPNLKYLSFGCHAFIQPERLLDVVHASAARLLRELHISSCKCQVLTSEAFENLREYHYHHQDDASLSLREVDAASSLTNLVELSIDWRHVTCSLLKGFNQRGPGAASLQKLNLFIEEHTCTPDTHPTPQEWTLFADINTDVVVNVIAVKGFPRVCDAVEHIRPGVTMLKILECQHINPADLSRFIIWHKDTLLAIVHVGAWTAIEMGNAVELSRHMMQCLSLKYLAFLGYYVPIHVVRFLTAYFGLDKLVVSRPHLVDKAEATDYLVPVCANILDHFQREMSNALRYPWKALPKVPFDGNYFAEGKDDAVYLTSDPEYLN